MPKICIGIWVSLMMPKFSVIEVIVLFVY